MMSMLVLNVNAYFVVEAGDNDIQLNDKMTMVTMANKLHLQKR